ncbi:hypothetical protein RMSM_06938 [Rhodopirellula maiorica SM1]|uniref:Uncharacterized protein n=1 Tax=Rhodopirellula maiorica SM1 TaxID=1265738 RepID=M5RL80_9BACT|nr:hypothetical protein RMSM_06938 [Rhodopirellula maiorica SM1]
MAKCKVIAAEFVCTEMPNVQAIAASARYSLFPFTEKRTAQSRFVR